MIEVHPLVFPKKVLDQHLVCLGKTGAGKSSALRHIVEYLLSKNKRVCIIDPKGDWNGLKVSGDGKGQGFPVILFGDFKETAGKQIPTDVPINEESGKHIAELITAGNRPCVVGLRGWTQAAMHKFWIAFASKLFNSNSGEFYLVIDEVHNFAPKGQIGNAENAGVALHWCNRLINEGRGLGLVTLIASQRPQKVHNDTLDACETLVAMRIVHAAARTSVETWLQGAGNKELAREILNNLAGQKRGEAYIWSPEAEFGPKQVAFPMFKTFDSFAPPQLQTKVSAKDWASVDLEAVKSKLSAVIEKAKAEDPKELQKLLSEQRRQIGDLSQQLQRAVLQASKGKGGVPAGQVAALNAGAQRHIARLTQALQESLQLNDKLTAVVSDSIPGEISSCATELVKIIGNHNGILSRRNKPLITEVARAKQRLAAIANSQFEGLTAGAAPAAGVPAAAQPPQPSRPAAPLPSSNGSSAGGEKMVPRKQNLLNALATLETLGIFQPTREAVALFVGRSTRPSRWGMDLKEMVEEGLITYPTPGALQLTDPGRDRAVAGHSIQSLDELHEQWFKKLPPRKVELLKVLIEIHPQQISRTDLAARVQRSTLPSRWGMDLKEMRVLGLIDYPQDNHVAASGTLFPEGLL